MQSTTKPWPPAAPKENLWVKRSSRNRVRRLKIATYNVRTLLREEHIQELEEKNQDGMGCNQDLRNEKPRGMFHYLTKRPPATPFSGKQRPSRSRLPHQQEMEIPYIEGKQHQPHNSRTCSVHIKALQTKDSATICTNNITLRRRHQ